MSANLVKLSGAKLNSNKMPSQLYSWFIHILLYWKSRSSFGTEHSESGSLSQLVIYIQYIRGGEWYREKRGSRKILAGSRNLGSVFDKSRSLVFSWFVFTFFESRNFSPKSLGLGFLTRISASPRVSDFTIRHPLYSYVFIMLGSFLLTIGKKVKLPSRMFRPY